VQWWWGKRLSTNYHLYRFFFLKKGHPILCLLGRKSRDKKKFAIKWRVLQLPAFFSWFYFLMPLGLETKWLQLNSIFYHICHLYLLHTKFRVWRFSLTDESFSPNFYKDLGWLKFSAPWIKQLYFSADILCLIIIWGSFFQNTVIFFNLKLWFVHYVIKWLKTVYWKQYMCECRRPKILEMLINNKRNLYNWRRSLDENNNN